MSRPPPADEDERTKAICERERNVIVDAGAGTGKTTLLINRLLFLIAPEDDGRAFPLERIAAITFTRKAAGELKLRLRAALLTQAGRSDLSPLRRQRLAGAVEMLDNALISTVHSFADRMLRLRPADAKVSPAYAITEDPGLLVDETIRWLLDAAERGSMTWPGSDTRELASEASETLGSFQAAGLRVSTEELEWGARLGFDAFVRDVIETRDRTVPLPAPSTPDPQALQRCVDELVGLVAGLRGDSRGTHTLRRLSRGALGIAAAEDFREALRRAVSWSRDLGKAGKLQLGEDFPDDSEGWAAWKWISQGTRGKGKNKQERPGGPLGAALLAPLFAWMAVRLVRLRPVILARYAEVKRSYSVLDHVDLLIELRDLLERNLEARAFYQERFDHLLVDEFQDTDPLQAEIVLYMCEAGAKAKVAREITLQTGKLTIVGDPKQSIYRFRRADIAMYADVCARLRSADVCEAQLTVNFRSAPSILAWLNDGFDAVLGRADEGPLYDAQTGSVRNVRLVPSGKTRKPVGVHVLAFGDAGLSVDESRDLEGEALAHYLRFVVEDSEVTIEDPHTHETRRPHYGDIAVMMIATQTVHHLTTELDRIGVPHVVRGGTLFMQDSLHRQFVLGLRALSDRGDGVAQAALKRPPFFAVGLDDLVLGRSSERKSAVLQATESKISELRWTRHQTTPGEVARRVIEQTGFGRYVAASVNGAQRLARLYQVCVSLDELARTSGLDFDGVTAIARTWIDTPPRIEAPLPIDADAVQVITAHQAKGLEWPIVALWDGRAGWRAFLPQVAFTVDAASGQWALKLDGLAHDPSARELHKRETALRAEERKRVAYVATTRARDLLIIPEAGTPESTTIAGQLLCSTANLPHHRPARYQHDGTGWWQSATGVSMRPVTPMLADPDATWAQAAQRALVGQLAPAGVTTYARATPIDPDDRVPAAPKPREGRFGPVFGTTVHRALALLLEQRMGAEEATQLAASAYGLDHHLDEALQDVKRTTTALRDAGLLEHTLRLEYPIAGSIDPSSLLAGSIDLLVASADALIAIDFKTDAPPQGDLGDHASYVTQARTYGRLLELSGIARKRPVKQALLFTADGRLRWV